MKKFISVVIVILSIALASFQQYSWIKIGAYKDADALQIFMGILWSCTFVGFFLFMAKCINSTNEH